MDKRKYKLINKYLSEVVLCDIHKIDSKFLVDCDYWKSGDDITIMIVGSELQLTKKLWIILKEHFSLSLDEIHMVMVGWIRENLGIAKRLYLGKCSYTFYRTVGGLIFSHE